jgi:hypothetical protein
MNPQIYMAGYYGADPLNVYATGARFEYRRNIMRFPIILHSIPK